MTNLTHTKILKLTECELPDSCTDDREWAIYENFDSVVRILHNYEHDNFKLIRKVDNTELNEIEIEVWLKEKTRISLEHVQTTSKVKSLNYIQDLSCDPRKLPPDLKLEKSKQIELANAAMMEIKPIIADMDDEQLLEYVTKLNAQLVFCKETLTTRGVKIREANRKTQTAEYTKSKLDKAARELQKQAKKDAGRVSLTKDQKAMKAMGYDYNNPADIAKFENFKKMLEE